MKGAEKSLVVYPNRWLTVLWAVISLVMAALVLGYLFTHAEWTVRAVLVNIVMVLGLILCLLAGISQTAMLLSGQPVLVVDARGITVNTGWLGVGLVRWEEITAVIAHRVFMTRMITIVPNNLEAILARQWIVPKLVLLLNARTSPMPINIPQVWLTLPANEIVRRIKRDFAREVREYRIEAEISTRKFLQR